MQFDDHTISLYQEQIEALNQFYPIIQDAIKAGVPKDSIRFGGGTALAIYYFQHRLSFDIDIFVNDIQYLSYFSPKHWIDDYDMFGKNYIDLAHHISMTTTKGIKIDILFCNDKNNAFLDNSQKVFDFDIYVDSIEIF